MSDIRDRKAKSSMLRRLGRVVVGCLAAVGTILTLGVPWTALGDYVLPNTRANQSRGVAGCIQRSSGVIDCSGRYSGGGGGGYYGGGTAAFNLGMSLGNAMWQTFQAIEQQAHQQRMATARSLNDQGVALYNSGDYQGALAAFRNGLQYSPNSPTLLGNIQETEKRIAAARVEAERQQRAQMEAAKQRIANMLGGLSEEFAQRNAELLAAADNLSFVAPTGTSFFGLGGGPGGAPPAGEGVLRFVGPGESLFSRGTKYSAPVDLREGASDKLASTQPIGGDAAKAKPKSEGDLRFIAPDESFKATVEPPPKIAARPPEKPEKIAAPKLATRTDPSRTPARRTETKSEDGSWEWARRPREPSVTERKKREVALRAFAADMAEAKALVDRIERRKIKVSDLSPEQRRKLADLLRAGQGLNETKQDEIAGDLENAAMTAWTAADRQLLSAKPGEIHRNAEVAGLGMAAFGMAQTGAGLAQYSTKVPVATALSLGQAAGGLYAEAGLRKAGAGIVGTGDATEIIDEGFESGLARGWHFPGGKLPSKVVSGAGMAGDSASAYAKWQEGQQRFKSGDSTGGWLDRAGAGASGAEVAAEGAKLIGKGPAEAVMKKLGGVSEIVSGAAVVRDGVKGSVDAAGNLEAAEFNARQLLSNAETLRDQGRYFRQRAEMARISQSERGRRILKELEASR